MTRSYKSPKQYVKHNYLPSPTSPKSPKKSGAGKYSWGSDRDFVRDAVEDAQLEAEMTKREEVEKRKSEELEADERIAMGMKFDPEAKGSSLSREGEEGEGKTVAASAGSEASSSSSA